MSACLLEMSQRHMNYVTKTHELERLTSMDAIHRATVSGS